MLTLNGKYEIIGNKLNCDFIRFSPLDIGKINTAMSRNFINRRREGSVISLLISYLDLNFHVLYAATNNRYVDDKDEGLVKLGPIALFSKYKLPTSSGKH